MLDIEVLTAPTDDALDILSVADLKKRLRLSATNTALDDIIEEAIKSTVASLHGIGGMLNRTLMPTTYIRYFSSFPGYDVDGKRIPILLPYPPLISVGAVTIEDGSSPENTVSTADYVVKTGTLVGEIHLRSGSSWPTYTSGPRALSVTYRAGYSTYPDDLRRLIGLISSHDVENPEATINEIRQMAVNRKIEYGVEFLTNILRVPLDEGDWNE